MGNNVLAHKSVSHDTRRGWLCCVRMGGDRRGGEDCWRTRISMPGFDSAMLSSNLPQFCGHFSLRCEPLRPLQSNEILGRLLAQPLPIPISVVLLFRRNCSPPLVLKGARLDPALTPPYYPHGHKRRRGYCIVIDTMHCQGWVTRCMQHEVGNMIYGVGRCRGKSLKCLMLIQQPPHIAAYDWSWWRS
jgi:hypothetical protein